MSFTPNYPTNLSINIGTDLLNYNHTNQGRIEDIQGSKIAESSVDDFNPFRTFITYGVLLNIVAIFGIIGNIIAVIILSRPQMRSSINYLLIGLSGCDTVLNIGSILMCGLPSIYGWTGYLLVNYTERIFPRIIPLVFGVGMISQMMSVYLTIGVTLERFVAVCQPLRARSLCTVGRAQLYMLIVLIFSILYNITQFWEYYTEQSTDMYTNEPVYTLEISALAKNIFYAKVYNYWMYLVFMYGLPFTVLAWFNLRIYMQVCFTSACSLLIAIL